jgi:PKD repeat protein
MASNFPNTLDSNITLYQVADGLRVKLIEDYNAGDTIITVLGDETTMRLFNDTGIITLTDQCAEPEQRAISFSYTLRTLTTFEGLTLLPGFVDNAKPKNLTSVTQNVMAQHHNNLKDAVIAIEKFAGKQGEVGTKPIQGTMEQRINYLRKVALQPKAWFTINKNIGIAPLTVTFTDQSFRLGTDGSSTNVKHIWDFGDNTVSVISGITIESDASIISLTSYVPTNISNVIVDDVDGESITKTYNDPGLYTVKLTVINDFGEDTVIFDDLISARFPAPDDACIAFVSRANQIITQEGIPSGGPFTTTPILRASINSLIDMYIPTGENPNTPGVTYGGEVTSDGNIIDPIETYTWSLSDDLGHGNSNTTRAVYSVGGNYDLVLRCDTRFGAYIITTYDNAFDIVEKVNLWLWIYNNSKTQSSVCEFG